MKPVPEGIRFTAGEIVVLGLAGTHKGLRDMAHRAGAWSRRSWPRLNRSYAASAMRLLYRLGDLKVGGPRITRICKWAGREIANARRNCP